MNLCGAINVLKPPGMTSFDVIQVLRKLLDMKKIGHAGTLDPSASGVLPVFIGKATKTIDDFIINNKRYIAEIHFGYKTNTYDNDGEIIKKYNGEINLRDIEEIINTFKGKQEQIPPMHSAIKINGKKLYKLAHKGIEIERPKREIEIFKLDIIEKGDEHVLLDILCSKGTYIRSLCYDIGEKSGYYGTMEFLLRTGSGIFSIEDAVTLEEIKEYIENSMYDKFLITLEKLFANIPKLELNEKEKTNFLNGMTVELKYNNDLKGKVAIYDINRNLFALGMILYKQKKYYLKKSIELI